jgi:hypothetical protein
MTSTYYMPISDSGKADLLNHLAFNLPQYQTLLNLSEEDLNGIMQDSIGFKFALQSMDIMQANAKSWTAYKNEIRDGVLGLGTAAWPIPPLFIEPCPTAVLPGVMPRLSTLVAQIKANKNYTLTVGEDLWLVGTHPTIDPNTWKPNLILQIKAGHPIIMWTKGDASAIEIWVDRGDGANFILLTINTEPHTLDNSPLPALGTSATWKYKAIYRLHDEQVGQWSDVCSIAVGG